ncbi:MAG: hypothetical protein H7067_17155, partial [Burkholderiales bacterium]|nr:hypothetical protein [Opitutaceae bacterium]
LHYTGLERPPVAPPLVNLLILDARRMERDCFAAACAEVGVIRAKLGLNLGVLVCKTPTLALTVAAIRCGLRDVVTQYVTASHLRQLIRVASPDTRLQDFDGVVSFLRTFSGLSTTETAPGDLARREQELARRAEEVASLEKRLASDKDTISRHEQELRERTRRFDRQLARLQTDVDIATTQTSMPPFAEQEAMSRLLDQRAAELDLREKLLLEMQELLTAQASTNR